MRAFEQAGHPVIRINVADLINFDEQFFLWEMATAVAVALLEINAFDQPNVQESKDYTRKYLEAFTRNGTLPDSTPLFSEGNVTVYTDEQHASVLKGNAS